MNLVHLCSFLLECVRDEPFVVNQLKVKHAYKEVRGVIELSIWVISYDELVVLFLEWFFLFMNLDAKHFSAILLMLITKSVHCRKKL